MAPYEALYGRPCISPICWTEVGESSIIGSDLIRDTSVKVSLIRQRLLTAQSRQKSYVDVPRGISHLLAPEVHSDSAHVVDWGEIKVDTDGTFEEGPVCIMDSRDQIL